MDRGLKVNEQHHLDSCDTFSLDDSIVSGALLFKLIN